MKIEEQTKIILTLGKGDFDSLKRLVWSAYENTDELDLGDITTDFLTRIYDQLNTPF